MEPISDFSDALKQIYSVASGQITAERAEDHLCILGWLYKECGSHNPHTAICLRFMGEGISAAQKAIVDETRVLPNTRGEGLVDALKLQMTTVSRFFDCFMASYPLESRMEAMNSEDSIMDLIKV